jgi:hypothetical protein
MAIRAARFIGKPYAPVLMDGNATVFRRVGTSFSTQMIRHVVRAGDDYYLQR